MLETLEDGTLLCPSCRFHYIHIDDVFVAGRPREDGDIFPVHVDKAGHVKEGVQVALPSRDVGRRHAITLVGWCENCASHFGIELRQHKGMTSVRVLQQDWRPLAP